ncbi:MAG: LysE family translocator [Bauldia sp.]|nr:LysE family translocator [Bauldia sp.]
MTIETYLAFIAASLAITIVPGPTVTLIVANSLTYGTMAGLKNVLGGQIGVAILIAILAVGLASVLAVIEPVFFWLKLAGAVYLAWLGLKLILWPPDFSPGNPPAPPRGGFMLQGFLVIMSNPKVLLVFGAFIPQFVDPAKGTALQVLLLGGTFFVIGSLTDSLYAVLLGRAGRYLSQTRVRLMARFSGTFLLGGAVWLALKR